MTEDIPQSLKNAAIIQIVSGVVNFMIMPTIILTGTTVFASFCSIFTFGLGGLLSLCGFVSCLLPPIGIAEIVAGAMTLTNPKQGAPILKIVSYVEMGSVLLGGFVSCIAGFAVNRMLADPEAARYLEG